MTETNDTQMTTDISTIVRVDKPDSMRDNLLKLVDSHFGIPCQQIKQTRQTKCDICIRKNTMMYMLSKIESAKQKGHRRPYDFQKYNVATFNKCIAYFRNKGHRSLPTINKSTLNLEIKKTANTTISETTSSETIGEKVINDDSLLPSTLMIDGITDIIGESAIEKSESRVSKLTGLDIKESDKRVYRISRRVAISESEVYPLCMIGITNAKLISIHAGNTGNAKLRVHVSSNVRHKGRQSSKPSVIIYNGHDQKVSSTEIQYAHPDGIMKTGIIPVITLKVPRGDGSISDHEVRVDNLKILRCMTEEQKRSWNVEIERIFITLVRGMSEEDTQKYINITSNTRRLPTKLHILMCPRKSCALETNREFVCWDNPRALNVVTCPRCNLEICSKCKGTSHRGECNMTSEEQTDTAVEEDIRSGICKLCPNKNCKVKTYKNAGCNHMTCRECKNHWCWTRGQLQRDAGSHDYGHNPDEYDPFL